MLTPEELHLILYTTVAPVREFWEHYYSRRCYTLSLTELIVPFLEGFLQEYTVFIKRPHKQSRAVYDTLK